MNTTEQLNHLKNAEIHSVSVAGKASLEIEFTLNDKIDYIIIECLDEYKEWYSEFLEDEYKMTEIDDDGDVVSVVDFDNDTLWLEADTFSKFVRR